MKVCIISCAVLFLVSCATVDPRLTEVQGQIRALEQQLAENPENPEIHFYLAQQYRDRAKSIAGRQPLDKALHHYWRVLELVPGNVPALVSLYQMYYADTLSGVDGASGQLRRVFNMLPDDVRTEVNAPSFAEYVLAYLQQVVTNKKNTEQSRQLLIQAIAEQPHTPTPYVLLSEMHLEDQRYPLAIAVLNQGLEYSAESPELHQALAEAYEARVGSYECGYEHPDELRTIVEYYRRAVTLSPDDADLRLGLGYAYGRLGLFHLRLDQVSLAWELEKGAAHALGMSHSYSLIGDDQNSKKWLNSLTATQQQEFLYTYREVLLGNGLWERAMHRYRPEMNGKEKMSTFGYLYAELARLEAGVEYGGQSWPQPTIPVDSRWYGRLLGLWQGTVSPQELLREAKNTCERTEANFFVGYQHFRQGDRRAALSSFEAALNEQAYGYTEYSLAQHFYRKLKGESFSPMRANSR